MRERLSNGAYRYLLPGALALLVLALAAAGCGGGGGGDETKPSTAGGSATAGETTGEEAGGGEEGGPGPGGAPDGAKPEGGGSSQGGGSAGEGAQGAGNGFIAEADGVCKASLKTMQKEAQPYLEGEGGLGKLAKIAPELSQQVLIPGLENEVAELRALDSSEAEEAANALIESFEGMIAEAEAEPKEFVFNNAGSTEAEAVARQAGFKVCGPLL